MAPAASVRVGEMSNKSRLHTVHQSTNPQSLKQNNNKNPPIFLPTKQSKIRKKTKLNLKKWLQAKLAARFLHGSGGKVVFEIGAIQVELGAWGSELIIGSVGHGFVCKGAFRFLCCSLSSFSVYEFHVLRYSYTFSLHLHAHQRRWLAALIPFASTAFLLINCFLPGVIFVLLLTANTYQYPICDPGPKTW